MTRLIIDVNNITQVLEQYSQIKIYRSNTKVGGYLEITDPTTRPNIVVNQNIYYYDDFTGTNSSWYQSSYFNPSTSAESALSSPWQAGIAGEKVGYTFDNYGSPPDGWGDILTPDDIRYTYFWGIDAAANDISGSDFTDDQFRYFVKAALAEMEDYLTIDIRKRIYKTNVGDPTFLAYYPNPLVKGIEWRKGIDYTDDEDSYNYDPMLWQNFGFLQLRHSPLISVERCVLYNQVRGKVLDFIERGWLRLTKKTARINLYPQGGFASGPWATGLLPWRMLGGPYPNAYDVDYTTGYPTSDNVPKDLRDIIAKWACVKAMGVIADGLMAGFSSQSVSLDGLSESFSSTQSPENTFFGARTRQYIEEVKDWLKRNRYKYGAIPMSIIGY